jgi:tetratricopeptide (TPR) repeat protein
MRKLMSAAILAVLFAVACPLWAQRVCPGYSIVIDTPEDKLTLAYNGADNPQEQVASIDKFVQENPDSKFLPCAYEYYTMAYLKLNQFDKVVEYGEKGLSGDYQDLMLMLNLLKGYVSSGKTSDLAFQIVMKAPEEIKEENTPARSPNVSDEEWKKVEEDAATQASEQRAYMEYAFFQLLQREPDGSKRLTWLDEFMKAYPDSPNQAQINFNYFIAYKLTNNPEKLNEYGEKAVASDPENVYTLNVVADDYASRQANVDKAEEYAKKALELAPKMEKSQGMTDEQFKAQQDRQLGLAHFTLGMVELQRGAQKHKVAGAIDEFKSAGDLLEGNPQLQGRALYYLGYTNEVIYPPRHSAAIEALSKAAELPSPWQGEAQNLLAKVKAAAR